MTLQERQLRLSLKTKWFEMTKAGVKTEDYRDINEYWCSRLLYKISVPWGGYMSAMKDILSGDHCAKGWKEFTCGAPLFSEFSQNIMTLGYPKSTDTSRILKLEHKGIEIREGNPEWGAEPGKLYFVIKHGNIL